MLHDVGSGRDVVKLIDFGLAKVPVEELSTVARDADDPRRSITQAGIVMGTVAYLAPEAALGMRAVRVPADLYSLGVVFYELLTGKHPFDAEKPVALFAQHRNTPPPPLGVRLPGLSVPPALEAVVMRLLAKDPDERFPDAKSLIEAIDLALDRGRPSPVPSSERTPLPSASTPPPRLRSPFERPTRSFVWIAAIAGAVVTVGATAFVVGRAGNGPAPAATQTAAAAVTQAPVDAPSARPVATSAREQLRAANESKDPKKAAAAIGDLATRDPAAFRDRAVQTETALLAELVVTGDRQEADAVFTILESKLGADGLDVLYDLVSRESKTDPLERGGLVKPSGAPARARAILAKPEVIARASPAMRVALEIRSSQCQRRTFLFARAAKDGDDRALSILSAMQPPTCGPQGGGCCTKHPELDRAIAEIQARLRR
jgi:serine/threonine-protein kinase